MAAVKRLLIPFLAIGVVLGVGYKGFGWENNFKSESISNFLNLASTAPVPHPETWQVFENYLAFLGTHNLAGMRSLSHQISPACSDPSREAECFALMDNVYEISRSLEPSDFKYLEEDDRQAIMHTDGPIVAILFFTKEADGALKILGLSFCRESGEGTSPCVEKNPSLRDLDNNGWWDSVESLFYDN